MSWTEADIPDLSGRVAVVTGANGGLGLATAKALAGHRATVVMAARNQSKASAARDEILAAHADASLEVVELDLASLASVERAAERILADHAAVDILVNNAGLMALPEQRTEDGFEMQFGVNHLGHWALTIRLLPAVLRAEAGRVITVTSTAHHFGRAVDPDNPHLEGTYDPWKAYAQSKLANFDFALGLHHEFARRGLPAKSLVAHPGLTHSDLQVHTAAEGGAGRSGQFWAWAARTGGMSIEDGALPQLRAATDPRARGGQMYAPRYVIAGPPERRPIVRPGTSARIERLWQVSERETGLSLDLDAALASE